MFSLHTLLAHKLTFSCTNYTVHLRAFHKPLGVGGGGGIAFELTCHSQPIFQKHNTDVAFILKQTLADN